MKTAVIDGFLGLAALTLVACGTPEKTAYCARWLRRVGSEGPICPQALVSGLATC